MASIAVETRILYFEIFCEVLSAFNVVVEKLIHFSLNENTVT